MNLHCRRSYELFEEAFEIYRKFGLKQQAIKVGVGARAGSCARGLRVPALWMVRTAGSECAVLLRGLAINVRGLASLFPPVSLGRWCWTTWRT